MEIAKTILSQLGGNKFIVMTGSKNFVSSNNSLSMTLTKNSIKAKWLTITLEADDTYTMTFIAEKKTLNKELSAGLKMKLYDTSIVELKKIEGVYNDMLQSIFTQYTGLYTKF